MCWYVPNADAVVKVNAPLPIWWRTLVRAQQQKKVRQMRATAKNSMPHTTSWYLWCEEGGGRGEEGRRGGEEGGRGWEDGKMGDWEEGGHGEEQNAPHRQRYMC